MLTSLPLPIRLVVAGLAATVVLVVAAVALRTSPHAALEADVDDPRPVASAGGPGPSAPSGSAALVPSAPVRAARGPVPVIASGGRPSPSVAVPASPASPEARDARALLRKEVQLGRYASAISALTRLLDLDPSAAGDGEVRADVVELAMRVMLLTGGEPDQVFDLITRRMGPAGVDVLYELVTTRGGSRAAARADELLRDDKLRALGTPALRIAYDLRATAGCDEKKALFPRARTEGDGRALGQLQALNRRCGRRGAGCCLQNDPDLREAMDGIKARAN